MSGWISVKERLPKYENEIFGVPCIVAYKKYNGELETAYRTFESKIVRGKLVNRWLYPWGRISDEEILYWMPLPAPPTDAIS